MRSAFLPTTLKTLTLLGVCIAPLAAHAHVFCVSNAGALQLALTAASDGGAWGTELNTIQVVAGTYSIATLANQTFHYVNTSATSQLLLQGGWNTGCTVRTQKAALTVLDGNHANQVLSLRQVANEVNVSSFTIQNGDTTLSGGGLQINNVSGDNGRVVVTGNIIRNNHTTGRAGGINASSGTNTMTFRNNVLGGNSADAGEGAGNLMADNVFSVVNNTIAYNTTMAPGGTGGLRAFVGAATGFVYNNIIWGNSNCGIYLGTNNVRLDENDFGTRCGAVPLTELNNLSVPPQFVDVAGDDFHLADNSPLFATVGGYPSSADPDGNQSALHGRADMGAYFDTVFSDGVESP